MATSAVERLTEFLGTAEGQKYFLDWMSHPVSQLVFPAASELCRPRTPRSVDECALLLGRSNGAYDLLDFITNPFSRAADRMRGTLPPARYGVPVTEPTAKENEK